jgi:hypothetical protein
MESIVCVPQQQQVIALGKLGWSLRRIEEATGVRRETASAYLKTAGAVVRLLGWGRRASAKPAMPVTTDPDPSKAAIEVTTDSGGSTSGSPRPPTHPEPSASACEPYREFVEFHPPEIGILRWFKEFSAFRGASDQLPSRCPYGLRRS